MLWVQDELSYDTFNKNADDICRVVENQYYAGGKLFPVAVTPTPLAEALKDGFPEIINSSRIRTSSRNLMNEDKVYSESVLFADPSFLQMFTYPLETGNPETALNNPYSIVLTREAAEKYFGKENPIGQTLKIGRKYDLKVTGIMKKVPMNSHLQFDAIIPFLYLENDGYPMDNWGNNAIYTYVQLSPGASLINVNSKIQDVIKKNNEGSTTDIYLQPLKRIYLYSAGKFTADFSGLGNIEYVRIFSLVALIVLLIACINFMNLSTARSEKRAREVGLRKVVGAGRRQLITQFYAESILFSVIALLLAVGIAYLFLPSFNNLAAKEISFSSTGNSIIPFLIIMTLITGVVAGSYPALYLSSFLPVKVLKQDKPRSNGGSLFRKVLVVVQYSLSIVLIIGTVIVSQQIDYIRDKDLGFNKNNLLYFGFDNDSPEKLETFKNELKQNPNVVSVSASSNVPTYYGNSTSSFDWEGKSADDLILMHFIFTDEDYQKTFQEKMVQGRFYSKDFGADTSSIVINQQAARVMGMENPVGKRLSMWGDDFTIIGVVKDFNFKPLDTKIEPLVIRNGKNDLNRLDVMFAKLKTHNITKSVENIEKVYKDFYPASVFNYRFLDESFDRLYRSENRMQTLFEYFSILVILISCMGLFGLASYLAERRKKEIGIRKVMGASVSNLTVLLSLDFSKWVLISNLIAWPLAYYFMNKWLQDFAYKIDISIWVFPLAGLMVLIVALLTISYQSIKTALSNPVDAIKYE
jgi:ABC-type antimicrobial peptide transport system permease subunit